MGGDAGVGDGISETGVFVGSGSAAVTEDATGEDEVDPTVGGAIGCGELVGSSATRVLLAAIPW